MAIDQPRRLLDVVNLEAQGFTLDQALRMLHALETELADAQTRITVSIRIDLGVVGAGRVRPLDVDET